MPSRPVLVAHADWSVEPRKRWLAVALRGSDGVYRLQPLEPVGALDQLLVRLGRAAGGGTVLLGVDFPIGLPEAYATRAGIRDFVSALLGFGAGPWARFYDVAVAPGEISLSRPFYPLRPGGARRQHLVDRLGLPDFDSLFRRCDRPTGMRGAACPLFWTLGGNQVGKGAITGWRDWLGPALRAGLPLAIWPFHGQLDHLLATHAWVVAEAYPREAYGRLGLDMRGRKGEQAVRQRNAAHLLALADTLGLDLAPALRTDIVSGFGTRPEGEDRFDSLVGLLGLLAILGGKVAFWEPDDPVIRSCEGWMIGQLKPD